MGLHCCSKPGAGRARFLSGVARERPLTPRARGQGRPGRERETWTFAGVRWFRGCRSGRGPVGLVGPVRPPPAGPAPARRAAPRAGYQVAVPGGPSSMPQPRSWRSLWWQTLSLHSLAEEAVCEEKGFVGTDEGEVVEVGTAARDPVHDVVAVKEPPRPAAGEQARLVPIQELAPEPPRRGPRRPPGYRPHVGRDPPRPTRGGSRTRGAPRLRGAAPLRPRPGSRGRPRRGRRARRGPRPWPGPGPGRLRCGPRRGPRGRPPCGWRWSRLGSCRPRL
jgi:hypothetical protein